MGIIQNNILLKYLPGKTDPNDFGLWLPVWMHLEDTAGIIDKLAGQWLSPNIGNLIASQLKTGDINSLSKLLAYWHDIGKFTPVFAARLLEKLPDIQEKLLPFEGIPDHPFPDNTPHALAGQCILRSRNIPAGIAVIIGAHHGAPQETINSKDMNEHPSHYYGRKSSPASIREQWDSTWDQWIGETLQKCGFESIEQLPVLDQSAQMLLSGLLIMADWIASNTFYFPLISVESAGSPSLYPERVETAWEKFKKERTDIWSPITYFTDSEQFNHRFHFEPNEVQQSMIDVLNQCDGKGIFILEAPMGCGKTEAALCAAEVLVGFL